MIDATRGTLANKAPVEVSRRAVSTSRQTTLDAFGTFLTKASTGVSKSQTKAADVLNQNQAASTAVHYGTQRGTGLLTIDVMRPAAEPTSSRAKNLVAIAMNQPVGPVRAREATTRGSVAQRTPASEVTKPAAVSVRGAAAETPVAETPTAEPPVDDNPITQLKYALSGLGIDSSTLTFAPEDYSNNNPGGVWVDHELRVSTQDGKSVLLAMDLLKKNYQVGACDVQRMLTWKDPV
jgi:hypothetical protein